MKRFLLSAVFCVVFTVGSYIFGYNPMILECFIFGIFANLLAGVLIDD